MQDSKPPTNESPDASIWIIEKLEAKVKDLQAALEAKMESLGRGPLLVRCPPSAFDSINAFLISAKIMAIFCKPDSEVTFENLDKIYEELREKRNASLRVDL